jgi:ferritin
VLDKLALVGTGGQGMFFVDKDLMKMSTTSNPQA